MQLSLAACLTSIAALSLAYTPPNYNQPASGNPINSPTLGELVIAGQEYTIKWGPTTAGPVSLVLVCGPSTNVVPCGTIVENIDNTGSYAWNVPTSLAPGTAGYGILLVAPNGAYQYSTQFGVTNDAFSGSATSSDSHVSTSSAYTSASSVTHITTSGHSSVDSVVTSDHSTTSLSTTHESSSAPSSHVTSTPVHPDAGSNSTLSILTSTTSRSVHVTLQSISAHNNTGYSSTISTASIPAFTGGASKNVALNVAAAIVAGAATVFAF